MSNLECPICKSDSYLNPNIKIFISPCFHKICEQCMYKIFAHGQAPCPQCGTQLRRINFISSTFEDIEVERDIRIRKLMNKYFKRERKDFNDSEEFNNYLEHYEDVVFELLEIKNDTQIKEKINQLKVSDNILVGVNKIKTSETMDYAAKKIKVEDIAEENWCVYKFENKTLYKFDENHTIPSYMYKVCEAGGFSKSIILDYISYSMSN